ncbi:MAG: type I-C CRISPR-associated protein Cas7/Csd2 [Acidobacteriaceae bacterium]
MSQRPAFQEAKPLEHRYELLLLFDIVNGNPNGDPDADNAPRADPETGHGLVTDVCIKRKVRNFVSLTRENKAPDEIYVKDRGILANQQKRAYTAQDNSEGSSSPNNAARAWMCANFYDIRAFGAVMTTGKTKESAEGGDKKKGTAKGKEKMWNCGQVRGPVQFAFSRSIDPVTSVAHTITRTALTNAGDTQRESTTDEAGEEQAGSGQIGRKHGIAYGLYAMHAFVSPFLATDTKFTERDLGLLLEAMSSMFEMDRSAARGEMATRALILFEHEGKLGNAPAHKVFETATLPSRKLARSFQDYVDAGLALPDDGAEVLPGVRAWRYV